MAYSLVFMISYVVCDVLVFPKKKNYSTTSVVPVNFMINLSFFLFI